MSIPVLILISQAMNLLHADEDKEEFRNTILDFADHGATSWKDVKAHIKRSPAQNKRGKYPTR